MPFGALDRQALGLSLLKAELEQCGYSCDVRYLNFSFAEFLGYVDYQWITYQAPHTAFAGEWCFTPQVYGERLETDQLYSQKILRETWQLSDVDIDRVRRSRRYSAPFLDHCMHVVPWEQYRIVGFTSTFEQNMASLAMARRIKAAYPRTAIVFGGANWEGEMGWELHRRFPFVDYVCSGEAEESFPALVRRILANQSMDEAEGRILGIVYRDQRSGESIFTGPPVLKRNLDRLPFPDFSDYFTALEQSTVGAHVVPNLLLETSRGCWWGAKSHCTFCGLNGTAMTYRSKSAARVMEELTFLVRRWRLHLVEVVDNILDQSYFHSLLPALAEANMPVQLFYEVKANLTRKQVGILRQAGVARIQPGIESLSDRILKLMRKGTTGLRNLQLLKWCLEYGIQPEWNLLYGFPGEKSEDYAPTREMLPAIRFLPPPGACGPVRLDRFSPYFERPRDFGLTRVRPADAYQYIYPFSEDSLSRIAYHFDFDYEPHVSPRECAAEVSAFADDWRRQHQLQPGMLQAAYRSDGCLTIQDSRAGVASPELFLSGLEQAVYEYCDELRSAHSVSRYLRQAFPEASFDDRQIIEFLDSLVARWLMVSDGKHYLSLAIGTRPAPVIQQPDASVSMSTVLS
jgi:ribosomal peptide maturation radical SAM protein 1